MKEKNIIGFKIKDKWTINDMEKLITSVNDIYNIFYALNIKKSEFDETVKSLKSTYKYCNKIFSNEAEKILKLWKKFFKDYISNNKILPSFFVPCDLRFMPSDLLKILEIDAVKIFENIENYIYSDQKLYIKKIVMKSDGYISFEGGKILKEIRKFIKDIWYRNRLEKKEKELEIKSKKLVYAEKLEKFLLRHRNNETIKFIKPDNELIRLIIDKINQLENLEKEGKLVSVIENLDYEPE